MSDEKIAVKEAEDLGVIKALGVLQAKFENLERHFNEAAKERDRALAAENKFRLESERLRKLAPSDKLEKENVRIRAEVADVHKIVSDQAKAILDLKQLLEKAEKRIIPLRREIEGLQAMAPLMQRARDEAQTERHRAVVDLSMAKAELEQARGALPEERERIAAIIEGLDPRNVNPKQLALAIRKNFGKKEASGGIHD